MSSGVRLSRGRFAFSFLMSVLLIFSSVPFAFGQDSTPVAPAPTQVAPADPVEPAPEAPAAPVDPPVEAGQAPVPTDLPVVDEQDPAPVVPAEEQVPAEGTVPVKAPEVVEQADTEAAQVDVAIEIVLDSTIPVRCEPGYWMFVLKPKPNPQIDSITVTFSNGNVETVRAVTSGSGQASFRTATNRDSTVVSVVAMVPETFQKASFVIQAGPCNEEPIPGEYDVTIQAATSDGGSAQGAGVTVTNSDGTIPRTGTIGPDNTFLAEVLPDGAYSVDIDGWPAGYNRVSTTFSVSNADRSVPVTLKPLQAGSIEIEAGESNQAGGARIVGASVTMVDLDGNVVAEGTTDERGKYRSPELLPSIYTVTVDGRAVGYTSVTRTISNETGGHLVGVVLERLPEEAVVTISAVTFDGRSVEGALVSIKGPGSVEVLGGMIGADNTFQAGVLPNGTYSVTVNAYDAGFPYMYGFVRSFTVAGEPVNVEVPLNDFPTRGAFSGVVRDAETGKPLPGVEVVVTDPLGDTWTDTTSAAGSFRIRNVPQGPELTLSVDHPNYAPYSLTRTLPPVDAPYTVQLGIDLVPVGQTITVSVVDWDGTVPADAWIEYDGERYELDANGQVLFRFMPDGRHAFTVKWDDPVRQLSKSVTLAGADAEVRFVLPAPVPSYSWALECPVIPASSEAGDIVDIGFTLTNTSPEATVTDVEFSSRAGSTFTQDGDVLEPGASITGVARIPLLQTDFDRGHVNARIDMEGIRPGGSRTLSHHRTNACLIAEAVNGTVMVVEADGTTPVAGATVTLEGTEFSAVTGTGGTVVFEDITDGTYQVAVVALDGRTASGTLTIAGQHGEITIALEAPVTLETVSISVGTSDWFDTAAGGSFSLTDSSGAVLYGGNLDRRGQAVFDVDLQQGDAYTVTAVAPGYRVATQTKMAGEGDLAFDLVLQPVGNNKKTIVIAVDQDEAAGTTTAVAPEGSTWTLTNVKSGKVYSGTFSGPLPQEVSLQGATGSGTFRVEIDAGPAFEPYTGEVTIRGNSGSLYFELVPVESAD